MKRQRLESPSGCSLLDLPPPIFIHILNRDGGWRNARELATVSSAFCAAVQRREFWRPAIEAHLSFLADAEGMTDVNVRATFFATVDPFARMPKEMPLLPALEWHAFLRFLRHKGWCSFDYEYRFKSWHLVLVSRCNKYCLYFDDEGVFRLYRRRFVANGPWGPTDINDEPAAPEYVVQPSGLAYVQNDDRISWMRSVERNAQGQRWYGGCVEEGTDRLKVVPGTGWWQ